MKRPSPNQPQLTSPRSVVMQRQHVSGATNQIPSPNKGQQEGEAMKQDAGQHRKESLAGQQHMPRLPQLSSSRQEPSTLASGKEQEDLVVRDHGANSTVHEELHILQDSLTSDAVSLTQLEEAFVTEYESVANEVARAFGGEHEKMELSEHAHTLESGLSAGQQKPYPDSAAACSPYSTDDCDSITTPPSSTASSSEVSWTNYEVFRLQILHHHDTNDAQIHRCESGDSWATASSMEVEPNNNTDSNYDHGKGQKQGTTEGRLLSMPHGKSMNHHNSIPHLASTILEEDHAADDLMSDYSSPYSSDDCDSVAMDREPKVNVSTSTDTSTASYWSHCESYEQELASSDGSSCNLRWEEGDDPDEEDHGAALAVAKTGELHHKGLAANKAERGSDETYKPTAISAISSTNSLLTKEPTNSFLVTVSPSWSSIREILQTYGRRMGPHWWLVPAVGVVAWDTVVPRKNGAGAWPHVFFHHMLLLGVGMGDEELSRRR